MTLRYAIDRPSFPQTKFQATHVLHSRTRSLHLIFAISNRLQIETLVSHGKHVWYSTYSIYQQPKDSTMYRDPYVLILQQYLQLLIPIARAELHGLTRRKVTHDIVNIPGLPFVPGWVVWRDTGILIERHAGPNAP